MPKENFIETDVLVIGGGMAGFFAAIKAKEQGVVDVTFVDKGYISKSGQSPYAMDFGCFNPEWGHDFDAWRDEITAAGEHLSNQEWIEIVVKDSYERYQDLISYGIEFVKDKNGKDLDKPGKERSNSRMVLILGAEDSLDDGLIGAPIPDTDNGISE